MNTQRASHNSHTSRRRATKFLSALLSVMLLVFIMPTTAFADELESELLEGTAAEQGTAAAQGTNSDANNAAAQQAEAAGAQGAQEQAQAAQEPAQEDAQEAVQEPGSFAGGAEGAENALATEDEAIVPLASEGEGVGDPEAEAEEEEEELASTVKVANETELRDAVNAAENGTPLKVILTKDIQLTGTQLIIPAGKIVTLAGKTGKEQIIGATAKHALDVKAGAQLTLGALTITHQAGQTGCAVNNNGTLAINGATLAGNTSSYGAGVYNFGSLTMNGGLISNNNATSNGGGVRNSGAGASFIMNGGTITNNTSVGTGGGVANVDGVFYMYGGTISNNTTPSQAGGVLNTNIFTLYGGEISGNQGIHGAAVSNTGTFTLEGGLITENVATGSAAIYNSTSAGKVIMNGGTVSNNTATSDGGGFWFISGTFLMNGGEISGNVANRGGGGVSLSTNTTFTMTGGKIINNRTIGSFGGGGVMNGGIFTLKGGEISGNQSDSHGGGVYQSSSSGSFNMEGGTIANNTARSWGGGVYTNLLNSNLTLTGGTISGNTAKLGGGIYNLGYVYMENVAITGNTAQTTSSNEGGGGVYNNRGTFVLAGGEISGNTTGGSGGGVYNNEVFTVQGGEISNNTAGFYGGGIYNPLTAYASLSLTIENGVLAGNKAGSNGGGVFNNNKFAFRGGAIVGNTSKNMGGGIYTSNGFSMFAPAVLDYNTALNHGGGISIAASTAVTISGGEITNNTATTGHGGGIWITSTTTKLDFLNIGAGVVFAGNKAVAAYERAASDDAVYRAHIGEDGAGVVWTSPFEQGYNNYDISYVKGAALTLYTVTFDANGGAFDVGAQRRALGLDDETRSVFFGTALGADMPREPVWSGHVFIGWNVEADGTGTVFDGTTVVTESCAVFAAWEEAPDVFGPVGRGLELPTPDPEPATSVPEIPFVAHAPDNGALNTGTQRNRYSKRTGEKAQLGIFEPVTGNGAGGTGDFAGAGSFGNTGNAGDFGGTLLAQTPQLDAIGEGDVALAQAQDENALASIGESVTPFASAAEQGNWSLLSLIMAVLSMIITNVLALVALLKKSRKRHNLAVRLAAIGVGIFIPIVWVILDNFALPMGLINQGTLIVGLMFAVQAAAVGGYFAIRKSRKARRIEAQGAQEAREARKEHREHRKAHTEEIVVPRGAARL
ncbi:MAG: InlB B-repeat-containing protein [Coriobacteriia bacterium]|nr:InlB B-repeat-containing protein [Coriobacteriia bacterium]